jgi:hypothetical protein
MIVGFMPRKCLPTLLTMTIKIISICVILPKMDKASKGSIITLGYCQCFWHHIWFYFSYFLLLSKETPDMPDLLNLTIKIISICVILPKMVKASKRSIITLQYRQCFCQHTLPIYMCLIPPYFLLLSKDKLLTCHRHICIGSLVVFELLASANDLILRLLTLKKYY